MARLKGWEEAFKAHEVHNLIGSLEVEIEELEKLDVEKQWQEFRLRATSAVSLLKRTLDNTVPVLLNEPVMRTLQGALQNTVNSIRNFRADTSQVQHLNGAETHIDSIVTNSANLPMPAPPITGDVFSATAERFKSQVDEMLSDLNQHAAGFEKRLESLTIDTSASQTALDQLESKVEAYNTYIKNAQEAFESTNVVRFDEIVEELNRKTSGLIRQIEHQQDKAKEILGLISEDALTTDYGKSAIKENAAANRYRWGSIAAMLVATGTLVWLVYDISKDGFSWESTIIRILIAIVLFVPSGYLARESLQHRNRGGYYKRVALELSVLGPFTSDLDDEDRKIITKQLVTKYFGRFGGEEPLPTDDP